MKQLPLHNPTFCSLEEGFKEWLEVLGYAPSTVYNLPNHVRELLYYLESIGVQNIKELKSRHIKTHYENLKSRRHQRRGGALSSAHLNKHQQAIRKFTGYLRKTGRLDLGELHLHQERTIQKLTFLTLEEIEQLFRASYTDERHPRMSEETFRALQSRDRVMLSIFYGCGLRRNEGVQLNVSDINFDRGILHVRKGKGYKERLVPISKTGLKYLATYLYDYRPYLSGSGKAEALFLGCRGGRLQGQSLLLRLKYLQDRSEDTSLRDKEIGLHTLRHSIATHLLQSGMKLESISRFLGHSSLESTQLYTHLAGMEEEKKQPQSNMPHYKTLQLHDEL